MRTAYADESGDPGFAIASGSSPLFTLTILLPNAPEALINHVIEARRRLSKPETFEFHFQEAPEKIRRVFFEAIADERFNLLAAVIHKAAAPEEFRSKGKVGLYIHAIGGLALRSPVTLNDVKLHLDGTGSQKAFIQALKNGVRHLCQQAGRREQNFKEIRILNSTHPLIQCADMLTGACAEQAETGNSMWLEMLHPHLRVWWEDRFEEKQNPPD